MSQRVVGTCSNCGGAIVVETVLMMVGPPPPPRCRNCGAEPKNPHGPVIPMGPPKRNSW
jgi:uncharacterized Zn finger protein